MKNIFKIAVIFLSVLSAGCAGKNNNAAVLHSFGITETDKVPADFNDPDWKKLGGNYVYFLGDFDTVHPKLIYIIGDKKENKIIASYTINQQIMPATIAKGAGTAAIVANYEDMSAASISAFDNMSGLNKALCAMPELKNFSWKNALQNTIVSGIILKTHFIYISKKKLDGKLFEFEPQHKKQDQAQLIEDILKTDHAMYHRPVERLDQSVEMNQYIKKLGFEFENSKSKYGEASSMYINDILVNDPIDFKGSRKMFFFFPFKSYTRSIEKDASPNYSPAVAALEYTYTLNREGFPVFKRKTHFVSLVGNTILKIDP